MIDDGTAAPERAGRLTSASDAAIRQRMHLLFEVGQRVGTVTRFPQLIEQIADMTRRALGASASSILLLDEQGEELLFEVSGGPVGERLRKVRINARAGIAGWVAEHATPVMVDNVNRDTRFNPEVDAMTGFVTQSILCAPLMTRKRVTGVVEVLNKVDGSRFTNEDLEVLVSVAATAAMAIDNYRSNQALVDACKGTARALCAAIEAKDPYTSGHSQRVTQFALRCAGQLSIPSDELDVLEYAGILHDVGKIGISESILLNSGPLSANQWQVMRRHPVIGVGILKEIPFLSGAVPLVLHHHERYDGGGYPAGLKADEIPLAARLLAVADAYEAMTSPRVYRPRLSIDGALEELRRNRGTQFDPQIVDLFIEAVPGLSHPVR